MPASRLIRALALSCHPIPSLGVTVISAGLAGLADLPFGRGALVTAAVLTGQLSIGWSNDYLDAERDTAVRRRDKPIATGAMTRRTARVAAGVALTFTTVLSAALGWPGGAIALATVVSAWAYNAGAKATVLSPLPYAFSFGLLPAIATLSASPPRWPGAWALAAGALLGVAAHLANALPDLGDDVATGVRGLPHRLGATATALVAAATLVAASAVILFGPAGQPGLWRWASFAIAVGVAGTAVPLAYRDPSSRRFFLAIILIAAFDVAAFALSGLRL
jgi:4-hydroxybenzoate polyprenyltransferase